MDEFDLSVCTTSYDCASAVRDHLASIEAALEGLRWEYIVVDNRSRDGTFELLREIASERHNFTVRSGRCSRGSGRQRAAELASAKVILVVDVDTIYRPQLRRFVYRCLQEYVTQRLAVQAIYAGVYPRYLWFAVGGMRNLNYGEDFDLWMRIWQTGRMRWTPVVLGDNRKPPHERDYADVFSAKYTQSTRLARLVRREFDLWRLRKYSRMDLRAIWRSNVVDLDLGQRETEWFGMGQSWSPRGAFRRLRAGLGSFSLRGR